MATAHKSIISDIISDMTGVSSHSVNPSSPYHVTFEACVIGTADARHVTAARDRAQRLYRETFGGKNATFTVASTVDYLFPRRRPAIRLLIRRFADPDKPV
jgi:hypothetical protein